MTVTHPDLPYAKDALEPHISARTLEFHHGKHHKAYVDKANQMLEGTDLAGKPLEVIIQSVVGKADKKGLYNNAAQAWNHAFFWRCMKPKGGGKPAGRIAERIGSDFGGYEKFTGAFKDAGTGLFGSGWVWLVEKNGKLDILQGANADTPVAEGINPLLVVDVWEHAYYLDYQNRRADFLQAFIDHLIDWDFVNGNLG